ncbi:hypothetical protein VOI54_03535 [Tamlana sp. 2201CG12-4]|uniref:hypothetical protein n=1 Tax=Tamlana sp. 2201CG12-4 TaxID=3112582 RepID=UPI002DBCCC3B|nr:hypothetical protein [Tamlana sp. 2201CG12-4]MEC3906074.1 hypothetical protein [Tamlana sp. 2201CG12-4]
MKPLSSVKTLVTCLIMCVVSISVPAQSNSDKAVTIANDVVKAMGGMENYNNTRFIQWDFGKRILYWDKWTGDVRIENPEKAQVVLVNINTLTGKAYENGNLVTDKVQTKSMIDQGKRWWINDSYWLVMPWKLEDPGVTLTYVSTEKLPDGQMADVLQLTFNAVGVTPQNKYYIYVDQKDKLIKQWAFFKDFNDKEPRFTMPWDNYQKAGTILLSFNRSDFGPKNVVVKQEFNPKLFTELDYK